MIADPMWMRLYPAIIAVLWLALVLYWLVSAVGVKRSAGTGAWRNELGLRLIMIAVIVLLVGLPSSRHALRRAGGLIVDTRVSGPLGALLCALGVTLAIVARRHLGRNWGMPMTRKEQPELVTSGPYAYIRHPIYSGMILAMLGSAIGANIFWVIPLLLFGSYFVYSARREEQLMTALLPEQYPAYMSRTRMLFPLIPRGRRNRSGAQ